MKVLKFWILTGDDVQEVLQFILVALLEAGGEGIVDGTLSDAFMSKDHLCRVVGPLVLDLDHT